MPVAPEQDARRRPAFANAPQELVLARADKNQRYQIFAFHDADPHGYNIARTLQEATRRMPDYQVEVIDLGLKLEEALAMGLQSEKFTRKKALPKGLKLTECERRYFEGRQVQSNWICERVEINAIPVPEQPAYLEGKLQEAGAVSKVIPAHAALPRLTEDLYQEQVWAWVNDTLSMWLSIDDIVRHMADELKNRILLHDARQWVEEGFQKNGALSWRRAIEHKLGALLADQQEMLGETLRQKIRET